MALRNVRVRPWKDATEESQRLLLMTEHTGENDYTGWLTRVHRQVAVKASHD